MKKDARVIQIAAACWENHSGPFSDTFFGLGVAEWCNFSVFVVFQRPPVFRSDFRKKVLLRSRFAFEFLYVANGTGFGPVRVIQEYSNVTPKCPYKKAIWTSSARALFWGSHFTWKNTRGLPIYLGKHKEPAILLGKTQRAHHKPTILLGKTQGAHQEPTILLGKTQGAHQEPTILLGKTQGAHQEPTRSPPFYLEKDKEPTRSPPFYLEKHKEPTRSPPFYLEKHKEPNLSPTGKYNNYWEVAEEKWQRWEKKIAILQQPVLYYSVWPKGVFVSHSLPRIKVKRGFAQQNFSLHAFLQATYRAVKKQQIKPNKTGQNKANQPTNQPSNQTNNQTIKQPNDQQITKPPKPPENKTTQTSNQPTKPIQQTTPNQNKSNQTKPNKTRKKPNKSTTQQTNQPTNPPTQPNKQTARQTKQKTTEPHNEDDPCRNHRIFHMLI